MTKLIFDSLGGAEQTFALLELIPDTHAWVKDLQGRFVFGNRQLYGRFGINSRQGLIGKTDFDLSPVHMAQRYRKDDDLVLKGREVTDRLELISGTDESVEWFLTSKWPIYNPKGNIIGSFGFSRHLNKSERKAVPYRELSTPISYINQNFSSSLSVQALAKACNLSISALERRFKKHLKKTPMQYINEVRLDHARSLLIETDRAIGTIAIETGFSDHSHFTRAFTRHFEQSPSKVRQAQRQS